MKKVSSIVILIILSITLISCRDSKIQVGILQYVSHQDLDDAKDGIVKVLEEEGFVDNDNIKITFRNPQANAQTMQVQASQLVRKSDVLIAIATPAAVALKNEVLESGKDTPIIFTAVTDPLEVDLVKSIEDPVNNVTGTSDMNPVDKQMSLVKRIKEDAKNVGIFYTSSEENSLVQANLAKQELEDLGLNVTLKTISKASDIRTTLQSLFREVDVIYIPSDNIISSSMGAIKETLLENKERQVPIIATTTFQVEQGASATYGFSYFSLGEQTGKMVVDVLNGKDARDIKIETVSDVDLILNLKQLQEELKLEIDKTLINEAKTIIE